VSSSIFYLISSHSSANLADLNQSIKRCIAWILYEILTLNSACNMLNSIKFENEINKFHNFSEWSLKKFPEYFDGKLREIFIK
jgi:hypothetical protein